MTDVTSISTADTIAANNSSYAGISILGTGLVSTADDTFRAQAALLAKWWNDLGAINTVAGTGDAITVTTLTVYTALKTGMMFRFIAGAANTTATTLNLDAIGAKAVRKISSGADVALVAGDIKAGETYTVIYRASANSAAGGFVLVAKQPHAVTRQVFLTGSGTYTTPAGCTTLRVILVGGGSGASGSGTSPGAGGNGGDTTFGSLTGSGATGTQSTLNAGGAATGGDINIAGQPGQLMSGTASIAGAHGASSQFGAGGYGGQTVTTAGGTPNAYGAGGGLPGSTSGNGQCSGASGGYVDHLFTAPAATYSYGVGAAGSAGTLGTSGAAGGAGKIGCIIVMEFY